jgi:hypothetical protein
MSGSAGYGPGMPDDPEVDPVDAFEQTLPVRDDDADGVPVDEEVPEADAFEQTLPTGADDEEDYPTG